MYFDQNAVIDLKLRRYASDNGALDALIQAAKLRCVLSPWHWVEASRAGDSATAGFTAQFLDSLQALWLRERIDLERREIQAFLHGRAGNVSAIEPIVTTVGEVVGGIRGFETPIVGISSHQMVVALRERPQARQNLENAYQVNQEDFATNVDRWKKGQLTRELAWRCYLRGLAKALGFRDRLQAIEQVSTRKFRAITTEFEVSVENWQRAAGNDQMAMTPQRLGDVFHIVVALPYVDYIVSRDQRLRSMVALLGSRVPFRTAEPVESLTDLKARL